eukprot:g12087.t1 g12087   contig6:1187405-1188441(-)
MSTAHRFLSPAATQLSLRLRQSRAPIRNTARRFGDKAPADKPSATATKEASTANSVSSPPPPPPSATAQASAEAPKSQGWWDSAEFWGRCGAIAGWGMSGAAIYDALESSPEVISLNMTGVLIVPNQMRRALEYKQANGEEEAVNDILVKAGATAAGAVACVLAGPTVQSALVAANIPLVSAVAAADAGPFTVHFWAPMSKWLISGASFMELDRPTEKISLAQYSALTMTGFFFSRYALLVTPINYTLCSVNVALFGSSAWHLGRKVKADFIDEKKE